MVEHRLKGRFNSNNRGIMVKDSAFRDLVGALCKLSLEMVNMQSGATSSLVTPRTEQCGRSRVSEIHSPRTLVRYFHLLLCTPAERTDRTAVRRLWHHSPASLCSIFNVSCIGSLISHGTPSFLPPPSLGSTAAHPPTIGPHFRRHHHNRPARPYGSSK